MKIDCGIIENSCTNPQSKASAKTAYVPAIRSMRDYIEQHYKEELFSELARQIDAGEVPPRYDVNYGRAQRESLCPGTEEIAKMSFWRQGECEVLAEIVVAERP